RRKQAVALVFETAGRGIDVRDGLHRTGRGRSRGPLGEIPMTTRSWIALAAACAALSASPSLGAGPCDGGSKFSNTALKSVSVVTGLTGRPLYVTAPPGDLNRIFIVEQSGYIRIHKHGDPSTTNTLFLDLSGKVQANPALNEMGLLGMAFDPD